MITTPNGLRMILWSNRTQHEGVSCKDDLVAETMLDYKFESDPLIIGTSGRYEYRNRMIYSWSL